MEPVLWLSARIFTKTKVYKMKIYFGKVGYGWKMYGIGYKTKWFLGFSHKTTDSAEKFTPDWMNYKQDYSYGLRNSTV